ncbi:MAG: hypothetical protein ABIP08_08590 [Lautropia sp.]
MPDPSGACFKVVKKLRIRYRMAALYPGGHPGVTLGGRLLE